MTIEEFVEARLTEDERNAVKAQHARDVSLWVVTEGDVDVGVDYDPARVLADVAAKRRVLREYLGEVARGPAGNREDFEARHGGILDAYSVCLRALASAWDTHPDYQQDWAS